MKILFITHETSRTGAPIVLLHFMKWLRSNQQEITFNCITLKGGGLENEFRDLSDTFFNFEDYAKPDKKNLLNKILIKLDLKKRNNKKDRFLREILSCDHSIIYANTALTLPLACSIKSQKKNLKIIAHIHELQVIIKQYVPGFENYLNHINDIIVPSNIVKENLTNNWNIEMSKLNVIYSCATISTLNKENKSKIKKSFTVGASGSVHWRKGHDIFLGVAYSFYKRFPNAEVNFIWVGRLPLLEQLIIEEDLRKLNLEEVVTFVGEVENPSSYFSDFDIFLLTSREDPFPLVCIEVGLLGKPIISFAKATGINEIIEKGGGAIVPYLDTESMTDAIENYFKNPELVKLHGSLNKQFFSEFTPEKICPLYFNVLQKI